MIAPLPQLPGTPNRNDRDVRDPKERGQGDFADLLAVQVARPLDRVFPDHGPAIVSVRDCIDGPAMTDPMEDPATPAETEPGAHVFNRDGFFADTGVAATTPAAPDPTEAQLADPAPESAIPAPLAGAPRATVSVAATNHALATSSIHTELVSARVATKATAGKASGIPALVHAAMDHAEAGEVIEPAGSPSERTGVRMLGKNAFQVAMRELEHGIHVAVRADAMDQADREHLRREIAALLSRHGLAPRAIRILAPLARDTNHRNAK